MKTLNLFLLGLAITFAQCGGGGPEQTEDESDSNKVNDTNLSDTSLWDKNKNTNTNNGISKISKSTNKTALKDNTNNKLNSNVKSSGVTKTRGNNDNVLTNDIKSSGVTKSKGNNDNSLTNENNSKNKNLSTKPGLAKNNSKLKPSKEITRSVPAKLFIGKETKNLNTLTEACKSTDINPLLKAMGVNQQQQKYAYFQLRHKIKDIADIYYYFQSDPKKIPPQKLQKLLSSQTEDPQTLQQEFMKQRKLYNAEYLKFMEAYKKIDRVKPIDGMLEILINKVKDKNLNKRKLNEVKHSIEDLENWRGVASLAKEDYNIIQKNTGLSKKFKELIQQYEQKNKEVQS